MRKLLLLLLAILCVTTVYAQYQPILHNVPCKNVGGSWFITDFATGVYLRTIHPTWTTDSLGVFRLAVGVPESWIQVGNGNPANSNFYALGISYVDSAMFAYTSTSTLKTRLDSLNFSGWTYVGPLPITLSSFTGSYFASGDSVQLLWTTINEVNNYGFDVQRRLLGTTTYFTLGFVAGHGTTLEPHNYSFADHAVQFNVQYQYRLHQIDLNGYTTDTEPIIVSTTPTSVSDPTIFTEFKLNQNYPNPFNPSTSIQFSLNKAGYTTLLVYNILSEQVSTVFSGNLAIGNHFFTWNAKDLPSGLYIGVLTNGQQTATTRMLLTK